MVKVKKFLRSDYNSDGHLYRNVQSYISGFDGKIRDHVIEEHYWYGNLKKVVVLINLKREKTEEP